MNLIKRLLLKFLKPLSHYRVYDSLEVNISNRGIKVDIDSLLTNDTITKRAKEFQKIFQHNENN